MNHRRIFLAGALVASTLIGMGVYWYRERAMNALFAEAAAGTSDSPEAVRKLGQYRGARSTELLLGIAMGYTNSLLPSAQCDAIKVLGSRADPKVAEHLARLLQPNSTLPVREAVADSLKSLPCNYNCMASVMHYLERISRGELNSEDQGPADPSIDQDVGSKLANEQQALYQTLYEILRSKPSTTLRVLIDTYGVGTSMPSTFALTLATSANLRVACPLLRRSEQRMAQGRPGQYKEPRTELGEALKRLECE